MSDLNKFLPDVKVETSVGQITLRPFRFKDMNAGLQVLQRWLGILLRIDGAEPAQVIGYLASVVQTGKADEEGEEGIDVQADIRLMLELSMPKNGVKLLDPEMTDWIDELAIAEVASLVMEIFELNKSFFATKVEKFGIKAMVASPESPNPGQESSADSSEQAIATPIS